MADTVTTVIYIIGIFLFIIFVYAIIYNINKSKENASNRKEQDSYIQRNNITKTRDLEYCGPSGNVCRFVVDDTSRSVYVSSAESEGKLVCIPYKELLSMNVFETTFNDGSLGGSILGGIMAGGVGSYLGATRGRTYIRAYEIVIQRRNIQFPQFHMTLFDNARVDPNSNTYKDALQFSREMQSIINIIRCDW